MENMQTSMDNCPICQGAEIVSTEREGRQYEIACRCVLQRIEQRKLMELFKSAQIPKRFATKTLQNFITGRESEAHKKASEYIENWQDNAKQGRGMFFVGTVGCGKTHLALAVVNELIKQGVKTLAATVPDLMDDLRPGQENERKIETLKTIDLLVLDDLGAQRNTEWATERLFVVLNARYNSLLPTIITSNTYLEELEKIPGWGRMVDRLLEMCEFVRMNGASYRVDSIGGFKT